MREDRMMNEKKQSAVKRILGTRGMGAVITAFAGLIIIYVAFGLIDRKVFAGQNVMNLLRSMSKYLLIGVGQSYLLITGNIDLSIGSMVGMSAMISATLMAMGVNPFVAIAVAMICCLVTGVVNGMLVGKFKLPPFIATLGTMFVTRGVAYMVNNNRNTDAIATGIGKEAGDKFQNFFYYGKTLGVYNTFWIALVIFLIFFFLFCSDLCLNIRNLFIKHFNITDQLVLSLLQTIQHILCIFFISLSFILAVLCLLHGSC